MVDVTYILTELDGTPLTQEVMCPKCREVYASIHKLLSSEARLELAEHEAEIVKIVSGDPEPVTLRVIINRALITPIKDDDLKAEEHAARYSLAVRIYENDTVELTTKEKAMINQRIAKMYNSSLWAGQAAKLIDPSIV